MPLSFALSITHFFSSVGADAGFAAIVGLAILILLYFSHARETSTLRDELEAAMRRIGELESRLTGGAAPSVGAGQTKAAAGASTPPDTPAAASGAAAPAPAGAAAPARTKAAAATPAAPRPAARRPSSVPPALAARPRTAPPVVAPAGVGAPPLSDATRVVPLAEPAAERAGVPGERAAVPAAGEPLSSGPTSSREGATALASGSSAQSGNPAVSGNRTALAASRPSSSGSAAALAGDGRGATPPPVTAAAGGNGFSQGATSGIGGAPPSLLEHGIPGQGRSLRWLIPALVAAAIAVIAVVLVLVLGSGSSHRNSAVHHRHHTANIAAAPAGVVPSSVTVAVVNATNINQLAHHVASLLTNQSFKEGTLATATNQSQAASTIGYLPGHQNDALAVAHALKLPASVVAPATQTSEGLVCPNPSSCTDDVIVVAGSNLAPKR